MSRAVRTLGIVASVPGWQSPEGVHMSTSLGRVVDGLAQRFPKVLLSFPMPAARPTECSEYTLLARNVTLIPQPEYHSIRGGLRRWKSVTRAYSSVVRQSDAVFVRGLCPLALALYVAAWRHRRGICHWVVGDPIALLRSHARRGVLLDSAALTYAWFDRLSTRIGRWIAGGSFLCNGDALGRAFSSPRTAVTVSSVIAETDLFSRSDTCSGGELRLLFVGYLRPEKGVEHLLRAAAAQDFGKPWRLSIVGPADQFDEYHARLRALAQELRIDSRIDWRGYIPYGPELLAEYRNADLLVLPTLSEGTPRVLVEARANSLPIVASDVGGIPSSVTNGEDGLLVPPGDPAALGAAVARVVRDGDLRRKLIRQGFDRVRTVTVDRFVDLASRLIRDEDVSAGPTNVATAS